MAEWCESCGQLVPHGSHQHTTSSGTDIGTDTQAGDGPRTPARDRPKERRILKIGAGAIAAWLAVILIARVASPDEPATAPAPDPTPTAERAVVVPTEVPQQPQEPTPHLEVAAGDVDIAQLGARMESNVQVERLVRQLGRRQRMVTLGYRAAEGVVLLDLARGTAELVIPEVDLLDLGRGSVQGQRADVTWPIGLDSGHVLLRTGPEVIAIGPASDDVRIVAQDGSRLVVDTVSGAMYWVPGRQLQRSAPQIVVNVSGSLSLSTAPQGVEIVAADGLGLLAIEQGPSPGTSLAGDEGFEAWSPRKVVVANGNAALEEVCDAQGCDLMVFDRSPEQPNGWYEWPVPSDFVAFGDGLLLAPDGRSILRHSRRGFAEVYDAFDSGVAWVTGASMESAAWDPGSIFVAWIDRLGSPEVKLMFVDEPDWLSLDLVELGLPRPISHSLVVFESSANGDR